MTDCLLLYVTVILSISISILFNLPCSKFHFPFSILYFTLILPVSKSFVFHSPTPCFHTSLLPFFRTHRILHVSLPCKSPVLILAFIAFSLTISHTILSSSLLPAFYHSSTHTRHICKCSHSFILSCQSPIYHLSHHAFMQSSTILPSTRCIMQSPM